LGVATVLPLGLAVVLDISCTSITGLDDLAFDVVPAPTGCVPGTQSSCYTGAEGTENVGPCRAGEHTCLSDGVSYSDCAGEVVPAGQDDCYTKALESCRMGGCRGFAAWSISFGSEGTEEARAMVAAGDGGAVLLSSFDDAMALRHGRIDRIDPNGQLATPKTFAGDGNQYFTTVADRASEIVVAGYFNDTIDLGDGSVATQGEMDAFVGVFDSTLMTLQDKLTFGSGSNETIESLAVGPAGQIAIAGSCQAEFTIETLAVTTVTGGPFVALLEPTLTPIWGVNLTPMVFSGPARALVAFDSDGDLLVAGGGGFDGCTVTSDPGVYVAKIASEDGTCIWSLSILKEDGPEFLDTPQITALAVGPEGPIIGGLYFESSTIEGEPLGAGRGAFVMQLSPDGSPQWTQTLTVEGPNPTIDSLHLALHPEGMYVAGGFAGTLTAGSAPPLVSAGENDIFLLSDIFVARLGPSGETEWAARFGDTNFDSAGAIVATPDGAPIVAGHFQGTIALGQDPLTSNGVYDVVVARLNP
jgi:hypothetical protein